MAAIVTVLLAAVAAVTAPAGQLEEPMPMPLPQQVSPQACDRLPPVSWRSSRALGTPSAGRLVNGVNLPASGCGFKSYDPILRRMPSRSWRRWGTDTTIRMTLRIMIEYARQHPELPPVLIGDISRPKGGDFGKEYGFVGHASHQNGLDIDVYYPRRDRRLRTPLLPSQVDRKLAQELVDAYVAAGAVKVFVGPALGLRGPRGVVIPLARHNNHLHARFPAP